MHNLEDVLAHIGKGARFQFMVLFSVQLSMSFVSWTMMEMSFVKAQPRWCCVPANVNGSVADYCQGENVTYGTKCPKDSAKCNLRVYEPGMNTIVNQWDLVCGSSWKADLSISIQMAGVLVGALLAGYMADVLGRKNTLYGSLTGLVVCSLIAGFSTCWEMFMVFRALLGVSSGIAMVVNIPYMMEFLTPSKRELSAVLPIYMIGTLAMTLTTWQLHDWRWIHWMCAAGCFPTLISCLFNPESLRWLTVKGKLDKAEKVVAYIARLNGTSVPDGCRNVLEAVYEQERKVKSEGKQSYHYIDIYKGMSLFKVSAIFQVVWFTFSFCGYGIVFGASTLDLNLYVNILVMSVIAVPVMLVLMVVMPRFGRKTVTVSTLALCTICGLACIVVYLIVSDKRIRDLATNILCLLALGLMSGSWVGVIVLNNESYPTVLRSLGYAAANTAARVGGILAPFAFDFKGRPVLSYSLIGGASLLGTILICFLKETHGLDMPDTLEEANVQNAATNASGSKEKPSSRDDSLTALLTSAHHEDGVDSSNYHYSYGGVQRNTSPLINYHHV